MTTIRQHLEDAFAEQKHSPIYSKQEVNYGKGTPKERCGNCDHFEVYKRNSCELVKGNITAGNWCNKWKLYSR